MKKVLHKMSVCWIGIQYAMPHVKNTILRIAFSAILPAGYALLEQRLSKDKVIKHLLMTKLSNFVLFVQDSPNDTV